MSLDCGRDFIVHAQHANMLISLNMWTYYNNYLDGELL